MDLQGQLETIDVTRLRGRRAVNRWERTSVGDVFERLTWSYPDKTAITGRPGAYGEDRFASVTYREADEITSQVAHALAGHGLEPGARVVLFSENSVEAYLAKIGIAKAGMVAVPINPALAPDVLEHLIGQAQPATAIVDAELWPRAESAFAATGLGVGATITIGGAPVAGSVSFGEFLDGEPTTEPDVEIHSDDIWQLLYTSGTTAMPKGVMFSHGASHLAGLNFTVSLTRGLQVETELKVATALPMIYHVGDQIFTLSAFLAGGSLVLGRRPVPDQVVATIAEERPTALWAGSPQFVAAINAEAERAGADLSSLTVLVYGWGALDPAVYAGLQEKAPGLVVLGIFGQTEAIACHRFWPAVWNEIYERTAPAVNYVGVPSPLLASDVVDETGQSLRDTPQVPGEVVYRSPIVTAGYYLNEEATREAFRGGWFHSGDSASVDADGLRIMVDRFKDIVKSGGENVSSLRVESVLHGHPAVEKAAVIGLPHEHWGEAVTAVVVLRAGAEPDEESIIAHCRAKLGGYETPKAIVFADSLPETVGGKILKYKLRRQHSTLFG
ncbi:MULTISPECIES: AMP-binding protein [Pseudonocardia]|uniref:Long-chain-fatty-acid--CoA ligase n=2 Tax=Pseudonocardia TaxID=1847 RepID=A0A1Y2N5I0_PSEAH|nr:MULTISPECIES: AMP-binding protein [Pseudonocardia]OSY42724.1 Long-chain-fatty-acid--CoA ligase [Pseudonocardia autotrophica]TDN77301.1 acyl-CoA synthetase (AMP-forming)/AMP-acid ligase II [Pseudonocardia autotrophica]BBG01323.1 acyl-CoA synthetase [Pseudonocardia autotrophica]GEC24379.1 acyl-CoA synthetase [Pseudonocardia saturnea]